MPVKRVPLYVGVDPGQTGGLVCIGRTAVIVDAMPPTETDIYAWFRRVKYLGEGVNRGVYAVIEHVHAMPQQGVSSTFKFGCGYGGLRMAMIAAGVPFEEIRAHIWQRALSIPPRKKTETKSQFKNRLKAKGQQLFPDAIINLKVCDALLIAEYCRRKHTGTLQK